MATHESHNISDDDVTHVKLTGFTYDHRHRLLSETTILNDSEPAEVHYGYDNVGRLVSKTYGNPERPEAITEELGYNIRGWLTSKQSDLFDMELRYNNPNSGLGITPSYAGNITQWTWTHKGGDVVSPERNIYGFKYDATNRLTNSNLFRGSFFLPTNRFTEKDIRYDRNGNIVSLSRFGNEDTTPLHDFTYSYSGNQLVGLSDSGTEYSYSYDANGNMIKDGRKALNFQYNYLNLIESISDGADAVASYAWLSDGTKVRVLDEIGRAHV